MKPMKEMKPMFIQLIIFILFTSCSSGEVDKNPFETKLYKCLLEESSKNNIDLKTVFSDIEKVAIETGNLIDNSPESYMTMFESCSKENKFPLKNEKEFIKKMKDLKNFPLNINCNNPNVFSDTAMFLNSKTYKFNTKLSNELEISMQTMNRPNIGKAIIETYETDDFKNDFIKFFLLSFIASNALNESSLIRELPEDPNK